MHAAHEGGIWLLKTLTPDSLLPKSSFVQFNARLGGKFRKKKLGFFVLIALIARDSRIFERKSA